MPSRPLSLFGLMALAATAAAPLNGCVPGTHVDASPVAGQVVDRATHRPVVGARVVLSVNSPDHQAQTRTDQEGRFYLPGFRHLEFTLLPYAMYRAPTGRLHVEATGHRPYDRGEFFPDEEGRPDYLETV